VKTILSNLKVWVRKSAIDYCRIYEVKSLSLVPLDVLSPETTVKEKFALLTMENYLGATYDLHHFLKVYLGNGKLFTVKFGKVALFTSNHSCFFWYFDSSVVFLSMTRGYSKFYESIPARFVGREHSNFMVL